MRSIRARIYEIVATVMYGRPWLSWLSLEQISDQFPFGICQVGAVRRYALASVRFRVAIPLGASARSAHALRTGLSRTIPCERSARRSPQRWRSSSAISLKLAWARSATISCKTAICLGLNVGGLPPALLDGSMPSSRSLVAMPCSFNIGIACHSYVIDFVHALFNVDHVAGLDAAAR